jgi:hypothetical protein
MDAITTTSDGLVVEGAIIVMAAADYGRIHPEFGILHMAEMAIHDALIEEEPHLLQAYKRFPGRKMFRGPKPSTKKIPIHNAVITGRVVNNNSATEMMNMLTMEEILLPILGQLQLMLDRDVLCGFTGEHISVGIGMTVAEKYGRVFPFRQFRAGDTAHASGEYSKTLKKHIPCVVAPKDVLATHIIAALQTGMLPGLHLGCSPAVIAVARALGAPIQYDAITPRAREELLSVGVDLNEPAGTTPILTPDEIIKNAAAIIPGVDKQVRVSADQLIQKITIPLG